MLLNKSIIPGYTLIYVLFLMTMVISMLAGIITFRYFSMKQQLNAHSNIVNELNLNSAITLLRQRTWSTEQIDSLRISLFNSTNDSVTVWRKRWGFFYLLKARVINKNQTDSKAALAGNYIRNKEENALFLGNCTKPLCISGNTILKGVLRVPEAGIKPAIISGKYFIRPKLYEGILHALNLNLPPADPAFYDNRPESVMNYYPNINQSKIIEICSEKLTDKIENSFLSPTLIIYSKTNVTLSNCWLKGNIIIVSDSAIHIENSVFLNDAIICSKKIFIQQNFKGTGQFIATDTISCEPSCTFLYPSILAVIHRSMNTVPFLLVGDGCKISGTVLAISNSQINANVVVVAISTRSIIIGSVYSNHCISLSGTVYGNVLTGGFIYTDPVSVHQNYLVDAVIDYTKQPEYYCGVKYDKNKNNLHLMKWVQ